MMLTYTPRRMLLLLWLWFSSSGLTQAMDIFNSTDEEQGVCVMPNIYDDSRHKDVYTVGVLAIRGFEAGYNEFNKTFSDYLTATAGRTFDRPIRFEMKPLNFLLLFSDVEEQNVDFIYVNPSAFSCIESQYTAHSLVSQVSKRVIGENTYNLQKFGGCIWARADNDQVQDIHDIAGKTVAAASISGLGSGQMQFLEMERAGMSYINDPKQLVFTSNQGKVIAGVLSGEFDVGFVRTDQLERSKVDGQPVNLTDFKLIEPKEGLNIDGVPFPFGSSTDLYPEWNVAALSHTPKDVAQSVQEALLALQDHAEYGDRLANNETDPDALIRCDSSPEVAELARVARSNGKYTAWQVTLSYMQLRSMQEATGFISQNEQNIWQCVRSAKIYDAISCPEGYRKKSEAEVDAGCDAVGAPCAEGYQCLCSPCEFIEECLDGFEMGDRCVPYKKFLPALLLPLAFVVAVGVYLYVQYQRQQADAVWKIKASELEFDKPNPKIVGVGTFGYVLLAEYRGTQVAVKRVIPPGKGIRMTKKREKTPSEETDPESAPQDQGNPGLQTLTPEMMKQLKSTGSSFGLTSKPRSRRQLQTNFIEEMRHLSKLRHPCITTVMGAVMSASEPMMVMEYMDHGSLYEAMRNEKFQYQLKDSMMVILQDIARGLRFLHAANPQVIHGDLKARNVLIDSNFRAKVADFGMSHKKYRNRASGTPYWMAPELFQKGANNTSQSDIYSFGIIIYEVYAQEDPYPGEDTDDVLRQVCDPAIDKRPPIPDGAPARLAELMKECIVRDPSKRPTAEQVDLLLRVEENVLERTNRLESLNKSLAQANEKIASASAMQLEHFASMSHEIRTPLNCIIGMSSLLETDDDLRVAQRESVRMIVSSGKLLRQIIDDVLDFSKLQSGRFEILIEKTDLQEVFMDVVNSMQNSLVIRNRQVTMSSYIDPFLDRYVKTDSRRLQQVLFNLLSNAVKYNKIGGHVDFDVRLLQGDQPVPKGQIPLLITSQRVLRLTVRDTGKGIERADFENIFRPFTQTKTGWQSTEGGTGLGLSITRKLVERLGGKIGVDSKYGEWSEFTVDFPHTGELVDVQGLKQKLSATVVLYVNDESVKDANNFKANCDAYGVKCVVAQDIVELSKSEIPSANFYFLVIHGKLFDEEQLKTIEGFDKWILVTFGTESSDKAAQMNFLSLHQQFPAALFVDLAQALTDTNSTPMPKAKKQVRIAPDDMDMSRIRVLVAEDNLVNQKVVKRLLNRMGVTKVDIAENGQIAVDMEAEGEYDVVLMDMQMPIMDGVEATKHIVTREGPKPKPLVIMLTAHVSDTFRTTCLETGASDYIAKPCTIEGLRKTLIKNLF